MSVRPTVEIATMFLDGTMRDAVSVMHDMPYDRDGDGNGALFMLAEDASREDAETVLAEVSACVDRGSVELPLLSGVWVWPIKVIGGELYWAVPDDDDSESST